MDSMPGFDSFSKRHPALTLILTNVGLLLVIAIIFELILRLFIVNYNINFYTATKKEGVVKYHYGEIVTNSLGYADEEFDLSEIRPRIGYFGDSVNYGVGTGYPYRFSELVEVALPEYAHWNLSLGLGGSFERKSTIHAAHEFEIQHVVYLLNLNDILPSSKDAGEKSVHTVKRIVKYFDGLRGRSYLYNYLRYKAKNALQLNGFEASGYRAYEFWPQKNQAVFEEFSTRVNDTFNALAADNISFCVVLLPYEMQISNEAEQIYNEMGFTWENGFIEGSPQSLLRKLLEFSHVYDPMTEFDRNAAEIGEYFVYNLGDKIDWNHPNRKGHAIISEGFLKSSACPFLNP